MIDYIFKSLEEAHRNDPNPTEAGVPSHHHKNFFVRSGKWLFTSKDIDECNDHCWNLDKRFTDEQVAFIRRIKKVDHQYTELMTPIKNIFKKAIA